MGAGGGNKRECMCSGWYNALLFNLPVVIISSSGFMHFDFLRVILVISAYLYSWTGYSEFLTQ